MTTNDTFRKEIRYDRATGDYGMYLNDELVGYERTYSQAETALDELVYNLLSDGMHRTAADLDGGSDPDAMAEEVAAAVVRPEWYCTPEDPCSIHEPCTTHAELAGRVLAAGVSTAYDLAQLDAEPRCQYCDDTGLVPNGSGTGDASGGWADTCECQDDDDYGDALAEGAMGTYNGRTTIDPPTDDPSPMPPPWERRPAARPLSDAAELAAELSVVDGLPLAEARQLAAIHLGQVTHAAGTVCTNCGTYGHSAADCPYAPLPLPKPRPRRPSPYPIAAAALLAEADQVLAEVSYASARLEVLVAA